MVPDCTVSTFKRLLRAGQHHLLNRPQNDPSVYSITKNAKLAKRIIEVKALIYLRNYGWAVGDSNSGPAD